MTTPTCLFCVNSSSGVSKYHIKEENSEGNTIEYMLLYFFGHQTEIYLNKDGFLCSNCMIFFTRMSYVKRVLIDIMREEDLNMKIKMINNVWLNFTNFATTAMEFNPNDVEENMQFKELIRSQTPNPLVQIGSEPYVKERDDGRHSLVPSEMGSVSDREVSALLRKRRKRSFNWTRRKGEKKSRGLSKSYSYENLSELNQDVPIRRAVSARERSRSTSKSVTQKRKRRTFDGTLLLKTRSQSRNELDKAKEIAEREANKFYCNFCSLVLENFDNMSLHKILDHGVFPRFNCSLCSKKYTSREDLELHKKTHEPPVLCCSYCRAEIKGVDNFQEHLRQHRDYTVDCPCCYLSFLTKQEYTTHFNQDHKTNKVRIRTKYNKVFETFINQEKLDKSRMEKKNIEYKAVILLQSKSVNNRHKIIVSEKENSENEVIEEIGQNVDDYQEEESNEMMIDNHVLNENGDANSSTTNSSEECNSQYEIFNYNEILENDPKFHCLNPVVVLEKIHS